MCGIGNYHSLRLLSLSSCVPKAVLCVLATSKLRHHLFCNFLLTNRKVILLCRKSKNCLIDEEAELLQLSLLLYQNVVKEFEFTKILNPLKNIPPTGPQLKNHSYPCYVASRNLYQLGRLKCQQFLDFLSVFA